MCDGGLQGCHTGAVQEEVDHPPLHLPHTGTCFYLSTSKSKGTAMTGGSRPILCCCVSTLYLLTC